MKATLRVLSGVALAATLMVLAASNANAEEHDYGRGGWGDRDDHHRPYWNFSFVFGGNPSPVYYSAPPPSPMYYCPPPPVAACAAAPVVVHYPRRPWRRIWLTR
jgi:hypothetical protein